MHNDANWWTISTWFEPFLSRDTIAVHWRTNIPVRLLHHLSAQIPVLFLPHALLKSEGSHGPNREVGCRRLVFPNT